MYEITLDNAVFDIHGNCVLALNWYQHLSFQQRDEYISTIGIYRAQYIQQFVVDALHYIQEFDANGFDISTLIDLQQRINRKVHGYDESIRQRGS